MSAAPELEYESYVVRIYRRDGLRLSGVVEVVADGTTHRFSGTGDLLAVMQAPAGRMGTGKARQARGNTRPGARGSAK